MELFAQVDLLAGWLAGVDVATDEARGRVTARVAEAVERWQSPLTTSGPTTEAELLRASLHEAAHAITGVLCGVDVTGILLRTDGTGGFTFNADANELSSLTLASLIQTDLAGAAAELVFGVDERRAFSLSHSPDLLTAATRFARLRAPGQDEWQPRTLAAITLATVHTHWGAVQRIAACLRAVGSLSGEEIRAMCARPQ